MSYSKIAYHIAPQCSGCKNIETMWQQLESAKIPFGVYAADDGGKIIDALKFKYATRVYRDTITSRLDPTHYNLGNVRAIAEYYWIRTVGRLPDILSKNKEAFWIEFLNEPGSTTKDQAQFVGWMMYYAALLALAQGYKICGPGWAPGNPGIRNEHPKDAWKTTGWKRYLELCAQHPDRVAVSIHEYSLSNDIKKDYPYLIGRHKFLFEACEDLGLAKPNLFITECGWTLNSMPDDAQAKKDINFLAKLYAAEPTIQFAALWTLQKGDNGELPMRLNNIMPWLTNYNIKTRFEVDNNTQPAPAPVLPPEPQPPVVVSPEVNQGTNLLVNPSFDDGWTDQNSSAQKPNGWRIAWNTFEDGYDNPYGDESKEGWYKYGMPEFVHKNPEIHLPQHESNYGWDGTYTLKVFAGDRPFWARLVQDLNLPAGQYVLNTPVWVDVYKWDRENKRKNFDIEPHSAQAMVKVNGVYVGQQEWLNLATDSKNNLTWTFNHSGGPIKIAIHFRCNYAIGNNIWLDGWSLYNTKVQDQVPQPPVIVKPPVTEPEIIPPAPDNSMNKPISIKDMPCIVDLSKWNIRSQPPPIVIDKLKANGVQGVILRASYGTNKDEAVDIFAPLLLEANMPIGFYHYYHPWEDWQQQLSVFSEVVDKYGYQIRLAIDLEDKNMPAGFVEGVRQFADSLIARYPLPNNKKHLIYTRVNYWAAMGSPQWGSKFDFWVAAYTTANTPYLVSPWDRYTLWQWTSTANGQAYGIGSKGIDLNRFNGTLTDWNNYLVDLGPGAKPPVDIISKILTLGKVAVKVQPNPTHALESTMTKHGYFPAGDEASLRYENDRYVYQPAYDLETRTKFRVYYVLAPNWGNVQFISDDYQQEPAQPTTPVNPAPPVPAPNVPLPKVYDLLPYIKGDGRIYLTKIVFHKPNGSKEYHEQQLQTQFGNGTVFYQVKNHEWEEMWSDNQYIYRGIDTSPGPDSQSRGRFYVQMSNNAKGAMWMKRFASVGDIAERKPDIIYRLKSDCQIVSTSLGWTSWLKFAKHHPLFTQSNGLTFENVVELEWLVGNGKGGTYVAERYFYALGYGLIGWGEPGRSQMWVEKILQDARPLPREVISCIS